MNEQIKISVIVPGYNVDPYLEECLDSLANQTLLGLQVIMVNDGSPGKTPQIMDEYAAKYENFEVIHQENQGLGAARNNGIPFAKGEYMSFVDSDDRLPSDAYEKMYQSAQKTNSDIVIGAVDCFNSTKQIKSSLHKKAIHDTIYRTHISKNPELFYDTTAWNKIFKKSFWDRHQFLFPTGMLYEDIPVTIPAHFLAESVDILSDTIYHWRVREGNDRSITQSRAEYKNFSDRVKALNMVDAFFEQHPLSRELERAKSYKWISLDYLLYINQLPEVDAEYLERFQSTLKKQLSKIEPDVFKMLPLPEQMKYHFVLNHQLDLMFKLDEKELEQIKPQLKNGRYFVNYPHQAAFSTEFFDITELLKIQSRISSVEIIDSKVMISGHAYIHRIDSKKATDVHLKAELVNISTDARFPVEATVRKNTQNTRKWGLRKAGALLPTTRVYNYDYSDFQLVFDSEAALATLKEGTWKIELDLTVGAISKRAFLANPIKNSKKSHGKIIEGYELLPKYNNIWELTFHAEKIKQFIQEIKQEADHLLIKGWQKAYSTDDALVLNLGQEEKKYALRLPDVLESVNIAPFGEVYPFEVAISTHEYFSMEKQTTWKVSFLSNGLKEKCLAPSDSHFKYFVFDGKEVHLTLDVSSYLNFSFYDHVHPRLSRVEWKMDDVLFLEIENDEYVVNNIQKLLLISREDGAQKRFDLTLTNGKYGVEIPFMNEFGDMPFALGIWDFFVEICDDEGNRSIQRAILFNQDTMQEIGSRVNGRVKTTPYKNLSHALSMSNTLFWGRFENSPMKKKIIQRFLYPVMRLLPIKKKMIIFESYWGRSYSCNPRAIYEYIQLQNAGYECIWFLDNENTPIDGNGKKVRKESWRYWYYLARGKYFVENANFPDGYIKRSNQIEIQTLHGTFLKKMGLDDFSAFDTKAKKEALLSRASRWDYLISPSTYMTEISKRVFDYKKEMLEVGFPRNDILYTHNNQKSIEMLKEKFGLPKDKKILLYAPTFRSRGQFKVELDLDYLAETITDDYVILMRLHYFVAKSLDISKYGDFVHNMSSYPDIQELYLVADVLMTDYSSVMFDYTNLKRPMLFFAYDLELYRDILRGMYLDYEKEIPGPIVRTTVEIADLLLNLDDVQVQYREKIETFYQIHCMFGRGDSTQKVYERVFQK